MFRSDVFEPQRFTSEGNITLRGKNIPYHTVSEDNVIYNDEGKAMASIFSYSYFRSDVEDNTDRPVLFCFNGGPGSASMMVHSGFLGTKRPKYPAVADDGNPLTPFEVVDNEQCMLDEADIVVVDAIGTGYGLLLDKAYEKDFYGIEEDAEAFVFFCEQWLDRYNRWKSPKYIVGESYGCTRAAVAAGIASGLGTERAYSFHFDGIVFIGNTVTVGDYWNREVYMEPSVAGFPTYAAVNWYHNHPTSQGLEEWVAEAKAFADKDYVLALYRGEALSSEEREEIMKKVMYYTGVSRQYLEENNLKLYEDSIRTQFCRDKGRRVSLLDGRITRPYYTPYTKENSTAVNDDAADNKYSPIFRTVLCGEIFPSLNIKMDRAYVPTNLIEDRWSWKTPKGTIAEMLSAAMLRAPKMRSFFANGWYDICTQIGNVYYTVDHASFPHDRVYVKGYPSGHMIYLGEENVKNLTDDILKFIKGEDPTK